MSIIQSVRLTFALAVLTLMMGCAAIDNPVVERSEQWDRRETVRIAFLPVKSEARYVEAAALLQRSLYVNLSRIPEFHILEPMAVEARLEKAGLLEDDQWKDTAPAELGEILNADVLMKAELLRFGAVYAVVETTAKVGAEVEFIDAQSGQSLYRIRRGITSSRGLSGIPTGIGSAVLEPLRGLGKGARKDLIRRLSTEIVNSLDPVFVAKQEAEKDEEPAIQPPVLDEITAVFWKDTRYLDVNVKGSPNTKTTFNFPGLSGPYPLREGPNGTYQGGFLFPEELAVDPAEVTVRMIRQDGSVSQQLVEILHK